MQSFRQYEQDKLATDIAFDEFVKLLEYNINCNDNHVLSKAF